MALQTKTIFWVEHKRPQRWLVTADTGFSHDIKQPHAEKIK